MRLNILSYFIFTAMALFLISGCATTDISIERLQPPRYPIEGGKMLAVVNFDSPEYIPEAGANFTSSFVSKLAPTNYYNLMERARLANILEERRFSETDYVDPDRAAEIGNILNVDYIITGEVTEYDVEDEEFYEQEERSRVVGYYYNRHGKKMPRIETYFVDVPVKVRRAVVSASFRMVNVHTGEIIVGESKTERRRARGRGSSGIASLPSRGALLSNLTDEITKYFTILIAPHPVTDWRKLEYGKTDQSEYGVKLAKSGLWKEAMEQWRMAMDVKPDDPAPIHNLGVAAEEEGDYAKAVEYYNQALQMEPGNQMYMNHLQNARRLKEVYERNYSH